MTAGESTEANVTLMVPLELPRWSTIVALDRHSNTVLRAGDILDLAKGKKTAVYVRVQSETTAVPIQAHVSARPVETVSMQQDDPSTHV